MATPKSVGRNLSSREIKPDFKSVQLFKDQLLGIGSYGVVYKAKCGDLLCAAKKIHETLLDPTAEQLVSAPSAD